MPELSLTQASQVIGQSRENIWRWCKQGLIDHRRVGPQGTFRISVDELRRFSRLHNFDFDEELAAKLTAKR